MQASLPGSHPPQLRILYDLADVGRGVNKARQVVAENGNEYIIKGVALSPQHPYVASNEFIAAELATLLGLPVQEHRILEMKGELYFGSRWMEGGTFINMITSPLFDQCVNRDRVYDLVAFDAWLCNGDRHAENLVVRRIRSRGIDTSTMMLNDHSHCLVLPSQRVSDLAPLVGSPLNGSPPRNYIRLPFVRDAVTEVDKLKAAIEAIRAVRDEEIRSILDRLPDRFLRRSEHDQVRRFLIGRKNRLPQIFRDGQHNFTNLGGGRL